MKLKQGDKVKVIAGKNKGQEATVERVYKKSNKVILPGVNMYKKHMKKSEQLPQGGVVDLPRPLNVSKVMIICPKCNAQTRIGYKVEDNKKQRFCKKCQSVI